MIPAGHVRFSCARPGEREEAGSCGNVVLSLFVGAIRSGRQPLPWPQQEVPILWYAASYPPALVGVSLTSRSRDTALRVRAAPPVAVASSAIIGRAAVGAVVGSTGGVAC
jgi:hypothetical protein